MTKIIAAVLLLVGLPLLAEAQVYKCTDEQTRAVTYSGTPCATGDVKKLGYSNNAIMDSEQFKPPQPKNEKIVVQNGGGAVEGDPNAALKAKLAEECAAGYHGYQEACKALRGLNGQQAPPPKQRLHCNPTNIGYAAAGMDCQ